MNDIELSHRINEIMLNCFEKEKFVEVLVHCVESLVMIPRFELIAIIDVLCEYMLDKNKSNSDFKNKINDTKKQTETWILSMDNKSFSKMWSQKEVPEKIQDIFRDVFDSDINELTEKYIKDFDEFTDQIEDKQKNYLRNWLSSKNKESEKKQDDLETRHLRELEYEKKQDEINTFSKKFVLKKTIKEWQKEQEQIAEEPHMPRESKKMEKLQKITNLKYIDSIQEIKKGDKERFAKIFLAFEKEIKVIPEKVKNIISELWYGNFYSKEETDSDDILNIVKRYDLHFKIANDHINGEVNRLILQTYIVGLYLGSSVLDIYTIINDVLESNPTMSVHKITPSMIHDNGNIPNLKIQEVLNPIIKNLPLHENQSIIRENWNKIRYPNIDITDLINYINCISMDNSLKFSIVTSVEELLDNIVKKGLTIERFAREVYSVLKKYQIKIPITEKEIIGLLHYE